MIFVDTSVWIAALRPGAAPEAVHLRELLDGGAVAISILVRLEILSGASQGDASRLRRVLSALPVYAPDAATWELIEAWIDIARGAGARFGVADLVIAAAAAEREATVWSLDGAFARMESLGFVRTHTATE